jgi:hypothetical protein
MDNCLFVQAQEKEKPDASAIYVPGNQTTRAIEEAIEAEIPLVVAVAEHVPIHDILRVRPRTFKSPLRSAADTRVDSFHAANTIQNPPSRC